jgi:hypothetical protein
MCIYACFRYVCTFRMRKDSLLATIVCGYVRHSLRGESVYQNGASV